MTAHVEEDAILGEEWVLGGCVRLEEDVVFVIADNQFVCVCVCVYTLVSVGIFSSVLK